MKSRTFALLRQSAEVIDALANVLSPVAVLERQLRLLANTLRDDVGASPGASSRTPPKPTVEFSEVDSAQADRALARLGVRRTR